MRTLWILVGVLALAGCSETVRCPDGQIFDEDGACVDIPDGGTRSDASSSDAGSAGDGG